MVETFQIRISAGYFLLVAVLLMLLPIQWVFAMLFAALIHELFHITLIVLLKGSIHSISIGIRGAVIETDPMDPLKELLCSFAGPVGSVMLLLLARWFPRLAICGAVHCAFNLLPLFPLDGGRILHSIIILLVQPKRSQSVWKWCQRILRLAVIALSIYLAVKLHILVLLCAIPLVRGSGKKNFLQTNPFGDTIKSISAKGYGYDRIKTANSPQCSKTCALHRRRIS